MKRMAITAVAAALMIGILLVPAGADRSEGSSQPQLMQETTPAPDALTGGYT